MTVLPIEEAPFWRYLEILREQGHEEDAELSEVFYVELLTTIHHAGGEPYTVGQVMNAKFKNIVAATEIILKHAQREVQDAPVMNVPLGGKILMGAGADKLSEQSLTELARRQALYHEENKLNLAMK